MNSTVEQLKNDVMKLEYDDRRELLDFICQSLDERDDADRTADERFDAILAKRVDDVRSGRVATIPGQQVAEEMRRKYP
jgi:putative addiction module component (TIGR02574 family)